MRSSGGKGTGAPVSSSADTLLDSSHAAREARYITGSVMPGRLRIEAGPHGCACHLGSKASSGFT